MAYQNLPWLSVQPSDFADSFAKGIGFRLQRENREQETALQLAQMAQQRDLERQRMAAAEADRADKMFANNNSLALEQQQMQMQNGATQAALAQRARESAADQQFNFGKLALEQNSKQSLLEQAREKMGLDAERLDAQFSNRDAEFGLKTAAQQLAQERLDQLRTFQTGSLENSRETLLQRGNKLSLIDQGKVKVATKQYEDALQSKNPEEIKLAEERLMKLEPKQPTEATTPSIGSTPTPLHPNDPFKAIDAEVAATMAHNPNMSLADSLALTREASQQKQALLDAQREGGVKDSPVTATASKVNIANQLSRLHPEWSREKIIGIANSR